MTLDGKIQQLRQLINSALAPLVDSDYWILAAPYIRNVGDHLIFQGEIDFLRQFDSACKGIHSTTTFRFPEIPSDDILFIHGGGFLGDVWATTHLNFVNRVIARYGDNRVVIFPQSTCFKGKELLSKTQAIWAAHGKLVVCARDQSSFDFLKCHFPKTKVLLVPDMAFCVDMSAWQISGVKGDRRLLFMRWDCEVKNAELMVRMQQRLRCDARDWPTIYEGDGGYQKIRELIQAGKTAEADAFFLSEFHPQIVKTGIEFLSNYRDIYTSRLHGLILSILMGRPKIAFVDNSYGKIGSFCRTWLADVVEVQEVTDVSCVPDGKDGPVDLSVVISAHKRPDTIKETLDSVFRQQGVRFEVIVINGIQGPDAVDQVVSRYPSVIYIKDSNCLTLSNKHLRGLEVARGEFYFTIDDDDYLIDPGFFKKAVGCLKSDASLAFVSGTVNRITVADGGFRHIPHQESGRHKGTDLFQTLQVGFRKPQSTCTTVFRRSMLMAGEPLFECSDSSMFLKALLAGDAYLFDDVVANYRVWDQSMTCGRGSTFEFKLNVVRQKEDLFEASHGKIADPLKWWCDTFKMNYTYFERSFSSDDERLALADWGADHAHGSVELEAFCREKHALYAWRKSPALRLDYFTAWPNFGDLLSAKLLENLAGRPVTSASRESAELMAAGSLFGLGNRLYYGSEPKDITRSRCKLVWGSGFHDENIPSEKPYLWYCLKVFCVRGRLSEGILRKVGYLRDGEKCELGDPGLLYADRLVDWKSVSKRFDLALVPHRYDQEAGRRIYDRLKTGGLSVVFVDVMNHDPLEPIRQIAASRKVLSSSLHGLIVADSMGIPNRRVVFDGFEEDARRKVSISHFKFADYYSAFGLPDPGYVMSGRLEREPEAAIGEVNSPTVPADLVAARKQALLRSFDEVRRELTKERLKVLIVSNGNQQRLNPFISQTVRELQKCGLDVDAGVNQFLSPAENYDVVHFEWPEDLVHWKLASVTSRQLDELEERIRRLKRFGVVLTYTRHNSRPHTRASALTERLYRIVEENVDAVFHMGEFSRRELAAARPAGAKVADYIVPHHLPTSVYDPHGRAEARKALGIDPEAEVVVAFGAFRNADEVRLTKAAFAGCTAKRKVLLAPRMDDNAVRTDNETLAMMMSAADVVFIQRVSILNSGNLPLGFMYGKVVVGPRCGNVGEILEATGNPTFDPADCEDAAHALDRGLELAHAGKGEENKSYAFSRWRPEQIAEQMESAYRQLVKARGETLISRADIRAVLEERDKADAVLVERLAKLQELSEKCERERDAAIEQAEKVRELSEKRKRERDAAIEQAEKVRELSEKRKGQRDMLSKRLDESSGSLEKSMDVRRKLERKLEDIAMVLEGEC